MKNEKIEMGAIGRKREPGDDASVEAANNVFFATADFLERLMQAASENHDGTSQELLQAFNSGKANIEMRLEIAIDGPVGFEFFDVRNGEKQPIFNILPKRKLHS